MERNKKKHLQDQAAKIFATEARNSTIRRNITAAFERLRKTVIEQNEDGLSKALGIHKPATDFSLVLQHLGTKPSLLPGGEKTTIIAVIVRLHSSAFSANASTDASNFEGMESYEEFDGEWEVEVEEFSNK